MSAMDNLPSLTVDVFYEQPLISLYILNLLKVSLLSNYESCKV